jgi:hypothetical protein
LTWPTVSPRDLDSDESVVESTEGAASVAQPKRRLAIISEEPVYSALRTEELGLDFGDDQWELDSRRVERALDHDHVTEDVIAFPVPIAIGGFSYDGY